MVTILVTVDVKGLTNILECEFWEINIEIILGTMSQVFRDQVLSLCMIFLCNHSTWEVVVHY